jgi:hypothetical protein
MTAHKQSRASGESDRAGKSANAVKPSNGAQTLGDALKEAGIPPGEAPAESDPQRAAELKALRQDWPGSDYLGDLLSRLFSSYHDDPGTPLPELALSAMADDAELMFEAFNGAAAEAPDLVQRHLWRMEHRARTALELHKRIKAANKGEQS